MQKDWRFRILILFFVFAAVALLIICRLFYLQVFKHKFLLEKSLEQRTSIITLATPRGDIFDAHGALLATSVNTYSIFAVPAEVEDKEKAAQLLAPRLKREKGEILADLHRHPTFVWLKRKEEEGVARDIEKLKLKGIYALIEKKRVYPKERLAASVLGFVGMDNEGLAGIELACDEFLKGKEGKIITEKDPSGYELISASNRMVQSPVEGMNVTLTIDEVIQYYTEKALSAMVEKYKPKQGLAIVMDPASGAILAAASSPGFDPNFYYKFPPDTWQSKIASFVYEPGSTFKIITVASAFQTGVADVDTKLKALDQIEVGGKIIENSHQVHWPGSTISVSKMLEQSINTGAVQLGLLMGPERFYSQIKKFGFGDLVDIYLPGESRGIVRHPSTWYKPDIAMITFGQSIAVTPLQLLSAAASIANKGKRMRPFIVKKIESTDGAFVKVFTAEERSAPLSEKVCEEVKGLMENVVLFGSGRYAKMKDFRAAGKTGTAQKAAGGGYLKGHYIASFVGFAPLKDAKLAILVVMDDPKGSYWGEVVAAPAFKMIAENSLRYLDAAPDKTAADREREKKKT